MGIIRQLPASVINQIAAGEVVERPASVLKELLENAIDAGAGRVDVTVERGGKDLIRVADDGKGMSPDDLPLAFTPHATSKLIEADDLYRVRTLGFRGEALAAIAEVSKVRCQSRTPEESSGSELRIEAGVASRVEHCALTPGTVIEVRHLFHNTPVRRTFLKSDATESGHVLEMFTRVALAHPTVHLTFRSGGKILHDLPPVTGIRERIAVFFGRELADSLLWVESTFGTTHVWGYVAHPSQSRSSNKGQYLFVGGRYVRDRSLGHALSEAYRGLLMVGRCPIAFLHLDLPPEEVDVNVHPTKVEVRFRDSQRVYSQLLGTIRQTFLASDLHARLQVPTEPGSSTESRASKAPTSHSSAIQQAPDRNAVSLWFTSPAQPSSSSSIFPPVDRPSPSGPDWAQRLPPVSAPSGAASFDEFSGTISQAAQVADRGKVSTFHIAETPAMPVPKAEPGLLPAAKAIQLHDRYLVVESEEGMVVIDQHALHERILYEDLRQRLRTGPLESQRLLVPEVVELPPLDVNNLLQNREVLARLGLQVEGSVDEALYVTGTPVMLRGGRPDELVRELAEHLRSSPLSPTADSILENVLSMVACKAAVKAGDRLSPEEISALVERRHLVDDAHHCPHGRPTALVFSREELERQFGRI